MDRYVRVRKIGEGSFGKALLVKKKNDGKHYVIKEINISKMKSKEREESRKEVKVLSQLKHPNIVTYMESFEETGNLYIVMDYCDGGDLYKKINGQRGAPFPEEQVMDWFVQIALGMKHVHDRKILHRDIKSQNIFLTRNGIVKLGDFGIARVLHSTVELARTCIGTPYYLSPEIVENRPYNNKSDVWSLGCVLYEMLTLKHAFEAGSMKNLVLKIIRGSYPPIPLRYSADVRLIVAQLLKRNPHERPSVNSVLKKNFIQKRIQKFLTQEVIQDEFSHTVLHRKPFGVQGQRPLPPRPAQAKAVPPVPRYSEPKAKYSVSVARKRPKKPSSGGEPVKKPVKAVDNGVHGKHAEKKRELDPRERRRRDLMNQQDQKYNDHMKKVQQQRWERQQQQHMNKAREQAWKATMSVGLSPEKPSAAAVANQPENIVNKDPQPMIKYQRPVSAKEHKENIPVVPKPSRPVSARSSDNVPHNPTPAWEAARQGQVNRAYGAEAAEKARVKEEFLSRKRAAEHNKRRGQADYGGYEYRPPVQPNAAGGNGVRNNHEQDYLSRLEAIRRQNYAERRELQKRMAGVRGPVEAIPSKKEEFKVPGDPRYDPDARRKKIAALKFQAGERAAMLRKQLDERKKTVLEKLNRAGKEKWEEEQKRMKAEEKRSGNDRPYRPVLKRAVPEEKPLVAAVGLETALKQVGVKTLFRSNSENDIHKIFKEELEEAEANHPPRKKWGDIPFQPRLLPLEVTASHMEATSTHDAVIKPGDDNIPGRRQWGQQKTQVMAALGNIELQTATRTASGVVESDAAANRATPAIRPGIGQTITVSKQPSRPLTGQTVTVSKPSSDPTTGYPAVGSPHTPLIGKTITVSASSNSPAVDQAAFPNTPQTNVLKKTSSPESNDAPTEEHQPTPKSPVQAWGNKPATPKGSSIPKSSTSPREIQPPDDSRDTYQQFLQFVRNEKEENKTEQQLLFDKFSSQGKEDSTVKDDLVVQDVSVEESSFHTADGSPNKTSHATLLKTGNFDTSSKHLRTCSMPDLRLMFATPGKDSSSLEEESSEEIPDDNDDVSDDNDDEHNEDEDENDEEDDDGDDEKDDGDDEEFDEDEEEEELEGASSNEEDEAKEYENMLASMRDVLISSARSPSPMKQVDTTQSMDWDPIGDTRAPTADDADGPEAGRSSELSNLNEGWDSGEGEEEANEDDNENRQQEDDDSVFQRLEESRLALEQELGFDRFLRVYRYLQSVQENEDEDANMASSNDEITEVLGDKEHLYPKILYLVIADSAYSEDNQGEAHQC